MTCGTGLAQETVNPAKLPWPMQLGLRSAFLKERIPVLDRVVLVPDVATFVAEVGKWSLEARWPVLIEDDRYTPLFVRRFAPRQLLRVASVDEPMPESPERREQFANNAMRRVWAAQVGDDDMRDAYKRVNWIPQGIVLTDFSDPAWPAALALAAGRGQLLHGIEGDFGWPNGAMNGLQIAQLENSITTAFRESGYSYESLGDELDALTLCFSMSVRTNAPLPPALKPPPSSVRNPGEASATSVTDLLCRNANGERYAMTGWIFGDTVRTTYMAMCSLFIDRDSVLLLNSYSNNGNWGVYGIDGAVELLEEGGYTVRGSFAGDEVALEGVRRHFMRGPQADVLIFNTSGGERQMNLASNTRGGTRDIPALIVPLALHMIHSFSLHSPGNLETIGARWLDRGVYAYVGSCDEPFLHAFVTPFAMVERVRAMVPFLVASRHWDGPMSRAWRIVTIGDPLMLIEPPSRKSPSRVVRPLTQAERSLEVRSGLQQRLAKALSARTLTIEVEDLHSLAILGEDELVARLWKRLQASASDDIPNAEQAAAVLPSLYASGDSGAFLAAFRAAGEPEGDAREWLWSLWTPRLSHTNSPGDLAVFQRALRSGQMAEDLAVLLPRIQTVLGNNSRKIAIARALELATDAGDKRRLKALLSGG